MVQVESGVSSRTTVRSSRSTIAAQGLGWERLQAPGALRILLPWLTAEIEATTVFMGPNHWKQGFAENQTILDMMCRYHYEQGLSERPLNVEELFARETHEITLEY